MRTTGKHQRSERAGFTLVELVIAIPILLLAMSLFFGTLTASARQRSINRQNSLASTEARSVLELMRNEAFREVYSLYNQEPFDDPNGPGTAPGKDFAVPGLDPLPDDADGRVGELIFPEVNTAAALPAIWELREDAVIPELGLPRDLNGDSIVDAADHAADYAVLPVIVRLEWMGDFGPRIFEMHTMLVEFN